MGAGDVDDACRCASDAEGMLMMLAVVQVIRAEVGLMGAGDADDACSCSSDTGLTVAGDVDDACPSASDTGRGGF